MKYVAAILETGDSFLHLENEKIDEETAKEIGGRQTYREYRRKAESLDSDGLPNYHTSARELMQKPFQLYREELLRPEALEKASRSLEALREITERPLNENERASIVRTAMKETEPFPRRAIDKGELLDRMYVDVYEERPYTVKRRPQSLNS
jgi:hypothetical protein